MGYTAVIDAVEARLNTVTDVGNVHKYIRFSEQWPQSLDFYIQVATLKQKTWLITRDSVSRRGNTEVPGASRVRSHTMLLQGILGVQDEEESELEFQELIDEVMDVFEPDPGEDYAILSPGVLVSNFPDVPDIGHVSFNNITSHFCEMRFTIEERGC